MRPVGFPSSSIFNEPRLSAILPWSTTVTPFAATRSPIRPANALVPLRLKSPSKPCPTASCSNTPGQPLPNTTVIAPAGAGRASKFVKACCTAVCTYSTNRCSSKYAKSKRPPPPALPISRRSPCFAITVTLKRTKGRISAACCPSKRAIYTISYSHVSPAITCTIRGSAALARVSTRFNNATLAAESKL